MNVKFGLTLKEVNVLNAFENRALQRIFGAESKEVIEGWRKLYSMELHKLFSYFKLNKPRSLRRKEHTVLMAEMRDAYKV
jgi:hypothetical protein